MNRIATKAVLLGAGSLLGLIGGALLLDPQGFLAGSGVRVAPDPDLMSEITAPAGMLLIAALLMLIGGVRSRYTDLGLVTGALVYGSYGVSRLFSMVTFGLPSMALTIATLVEIGVALLLVLLRLCRRPQDRQHLPYAYPGELVI
jgi:hypothetical protein